MDRYKLTLRHDLREVEIFAYFCSSSSLLCDVQLWRKINVIIGKASVTSNEDNYVEIRVQSGIIITERVLPPPSPITSFFHLNLLLTIAASWTIVLSCFQKKQKTTRVLWGFPDLLNGINAPINRPLVWTVTRTP